MDWQEKLASLMELIETKDPKTAIEEIVDLSNNVSDSDLSQFFEKDVAIEKYTTLAKDVYSKYILKMESDGLDHILSSCVDQQSRFCDVAEADAKMAFDRMADIFGTLTLHPETRFIMVGCGQLPVTAIHVLERAGCRHVVCMDVVERAIDAAGRLKRAFGWSALDPILCDGADYDFSQADAVYIANMVSPKAAVIAQVARTASPECQIVVREPYGLGQLWADRGEAALPDCLAVSAYGEGSRYLSRDVFLSWRR